jgi:hypothetical protein
MRGDSAERRFSTGSAGTALTHSTETVVAQDNISYERYRAEMLFTSTVRKIFLRFVTAVIFLIINSKIKKYVV